MPVGHHSNGKRLRFGRVLALLAVLCVFAALVAIARSCAGSP